MNSLKVRRKKQKNKIKSVHLTPGKKKKNSQESIEKMELSPQRLQELRGNLCC